MKRRDGHALSCSVALPVPGPGFRVEFWADFGRKANVNGPQTGPDCPGRRPGQFWDRFLSPFALGLMPKA